MRVAPRRGRRKASYAYLFQISMQAHLERGVLKLVVLKGPKLMLKVL